jgi:hypothetical protein
MKQNMRRGWQVALGIVLVLILAGCGATAGEPTVEMTPPGESTTGAVTPVTVDMDAVTQAPAEEETPREMPGPGIPDPEAFMTDRVKTALADRLGVGVETISVTNIEAVEWPDAALGCPIPGQAYAQVLTPGFEIVLSAGGETYTYHTDKEGTMVLCGEDGQPAGEEE